jgi:hypothetical protein
MKQLAKGGLYYSSAKFYETGIEDDFYFMIHNVKCFST